MLMTAGSALRGRLMDFTAGALTAKSHRQGQQHRQGGHEQRVDQQHRRSGRGVLRVVFKSKVCCQYYYFQYNTYIITIIICIK